MDTEPRTVWLLVYPAADVADQWIAHCLDLDVVTQGNSIEHAIIMGREAVDLVVRADLEAGLDPFEREQAPADEWEPFFHLMRHAVPLRRIPREHWGNIRLLASSYDVLLPIADEANDTPDMTHEIPEAWMLSRYQEQRDSGSFPPHG